MWVSMNEEEANVYMFWEPCRKKRLESRLEGVGSGSLKDRTN